VNRPLYEYSARELRALAGRRLSHEIPPSATEFSLPSGRGDDDLDVGTKLGKLLYNEIRSASVLVPVIARGETAHVVLTQRPDDLPVHGGQISFPGGKADARDRDLFETALRESHEEIGLRPDQVSVLGVLDTYQTVTGFRVLPVVGLVEPDFQPQIDRREVAEAFEVPLSFLMDPVNHQRHGREIHGLRRNYYVMPYGERYIWGATAGIVKNMYDRLYA